MSIESINSSQMGQVQTSQSQQARATVEGTFMGHAVAVEDSPESLLADAAEELGFAVDSHEDCEATERKEREAAASERLKKLYEVLMSQAGKSQQMQNVVDSLKRLADRQAMRHAVAKEFSDNTDAWAALQHAIDVLSGDPEVTKEQVAEMKALSDEMMAEHGQEIRMGLQGAVTGSEYADVVGSEAGKGLYQKTVGEFSSVTEVFSDIKEKFGAQFDRAMDFLFAAVSADIESEVPSMGKAHLESVHAKLGLVRLTQSAFRLCEDVATRWKDVHHVESGFSAMTLLEDVMKWTSQSFLSASEVREAAMKAAPPDIEHEVLILQEILSAVRKFPTALFGDDNARATVTSAVQEAVDDAVQREDEYLATL